MEKPEEKRGERRSQIQIYADIVRLIIRRGGAAKPTHILYGANLSHARLIKHLTWLLEKGFIAEEHSAGQKVYIVTPKGHNFLKEFKKNEEMSEAFGIPI